MFLTEYCFGGFWTLDFRSFGCWTLGELGERKKKTYGGMKAVDKLMLLIQLFKINTKAFDKTVCLWGIFLGGFTGWPMGM